MSVSLRDYQLDLIEQARALMTQGCRSLIIQAPTGAGKTVLIAHMLAKAAEKGKRAWYICHRRELINQATEEFKRADIQPGIISAGYEPSDRPIQICSIQTLSRRMAHINDRPDLVIWDECHHNAAKTWSNLWKQMPDAFHIGLTATPERLDGKGLGNYFSALIQGPGVRDLINQGYLSDYRIFAPPLMDCKGIRKIAGDYQKSEIFARFKAGNIMGDVVKEYIKHAHGKQALAFGCMIEHSKFIVESFVNAGYYAHHIDGETDRWLRDKLVTAYERSEYPVLSNCELFGEGFNVTGISAVLLCSGTASFSRYRQWIGRALRPHPGKKYAVILDFAGNTHRHGLPDDPIQWSLEGRRGRESVKNPFRTCPKCYFIQKIQFPKCNECNFSFPIKKKKAPEHVSGELVEFKPGELRRKRKFEQSRARTLTELIELGRKRGYRNPYWWGLNIFNARGKRRGRK